MVNLFWRIFWPILVITAMVGMIALVALLFTPHDGVWFLCDLSTWKDVTTGSGIIFGILGSVILVLPGLAALADRENRIEALRNGTDFGAESNDPKKTLQYISKIQAAGGNLLSNLLTLFMVSPEERRLIRGGLWLVVVSFVVQGLAIAFPYIPWLR